MLCDYMNLKKNDPRYFEVDEDIEYNDTEDAKFKKLFV